MDNKIHKIISSSKCVKEFHYYPSENEYFEDIYNLKCVFIVEDENESRREVSILFEDVCDLIIDLSEGMKYLGVPELLDVQSEGWETRKYIVRDLELENEFKFMCNDAKVI